eukprot:scaffold5217_cov632-Prasinococcus_capsulatus_cf.AAC.3
MDGDLQNDPSDIPRLVKVLLEGEDADGMAIQSRLTGRRGYDLVCGWRQDRKDDNFTRRLPSFLANLLISKMTGVKLKDYGCSLKAFQRDLVDQLRPYGEMHRFLPMLAVLEGATLTEMPVKHHARSAGESKYSALGRTPRVLADLATILFMQKFMTKPMHFMGVVGGLLMLAGVLVMIASIAVHIPTLCYMSIGEVFSLVCGFLVLGLELFISGIQVLVLGFIAEVLVRTYFESQGRPIYTVRTILGEGLILCITPSTQHSRWLCNASLTWLRAPAAQSCRAKVLTLSQYSKALQHNHRACAGKSRLVWVSTTASTAKNIINNKATKRGRRTRP